MKSFAYFLLMVICMVSHAIEKSQTVTPTVILKTTTSWDGKPLVYPQGQAEITGIQVDIAVGGETGWHQHPVPNFGIILAGELEVTLKNGEKKRLKAGETLAEVVNTLHNGRNVGEVPVRLIVFYAGSVEHQQLSIKEVH